MAIDETDQLVAEMELIRRQGLGAAQRLNRDMIRLVDWREHVRSSPLPFVIAAAAVGYLIVPGRRLDSSPTISGQLDHSGDRAIQASRQGSTGQVMSGLRSLALTLAGRWARTVVSDFMRQQLRSTVEQQDDRTARPQRPQVHRDGARSID